MCGFIIAVTHSWSVDQGTVQQAIPAHGASRMHADAADRHGREAQYQLRRG